MLTGASFSIPYKSRITGTKIRPFIILTAGIFITDRGRCTAFVDVYGLKT